MKRESNIDIYRKAHWGIDPDEVRKVYHPAAFAPLAQMGWLEEVELRDRIRSPKVQYSLNFLENGKPRGSVAFDGPPATRLFMLISAPMRAEIRALIADLEAQGVEWSTTSALAEAAGGRQVRFTEVDEQVMPLGLLWAVTYQTHKRGDPPSRYRHRMGEHNGLPPYLAADEEGYLYVCGGTYSVEPRGIVF